MERALASPGHFYEISRRVYTLIQVGCVGGIGKYVITLFFLYLIFFSSLFIVILIYKLNRN